MAARDDVHPALTLRWDAPQTVRTIELSFDADFDHPMESVLMTHPERAMPFCIKTLRVCAGFRREGEQEVALIEDNHQVRRRIVLVQPAPLNSLTLQVLETWSDAPAALFEVRCYE